MCFVLYFYFFFFFQAEDGIRDYKVTGVQTCALPISAPASASQEPGREDVTTEANPLLGDTREAIERKEYDVALAGVDKLLEGSPRNPELLDLKKSILYEYGKESLDQKNYDDSYRALSQLTKLDAR